MPKKKTSRKTSPRSLQSLEALIASKADDAVSLWNWAELFHEDDDAIIDAFLNESRREAHDFRSGQELRERIDRDRSHLAAVLSPADLKVFRRLENDVYSRHFIAMDAMYVFGRAIGERVPGGAR